MMPTTMTAITVESARRVTHIRTKALVVEKPDRMIEMMPTRIRATRAANRRRVRGAAGSFLVPTTVSFAAAEPKRTSTADAAGEGSGSSIVSWESATGCRQAVSAAVAAGCSRRIHSLAFSHYGLVSIGAAGVSSTGRTGADSSTAGSQPLRRSEGGSGGDLDGDDGGWD